MVIGIYLDSYFFVFGTAILKYGLTLKSGNTCQGAIYLCLVAYITSKVSSFSPPDANPRIFSSGGMCMYRMLTSVVHLHRWFVAHA